MKKILFIDACIRGENSRTKTLAESFLADYGQEVDRLNLMEEGLHYFSGEFFWQRERLLEEKNLNHPRFRYAHQFAKADKIVIAAPFWDLSFPAILKVYLENISVDSITFAVNEKGIFGLCKAEKMLFITTRGGSYENDEMEMGVRTLKAMAKFFGIKKFIAYGVDGMDEGKVPVEELLNKAKRELKELAKNF